MSRVGPGHGSAKNFQRVGRVKQKIVTGQAGQEKICHGSDGSKNFVKNHYFSCKFSKLTSKLCFLLHEIEVFAEKMQISLKMLAKKLSRVRRVKPKIDTGQTGHRKNLTGQPGQGCYESGRVGSGRSSKDHGSGRVGSKIPI